MSFRTGFTFLNSW